MMVSQKIKKKNRITTWFSNSTLGICPKELNAKTQTDIYIPILIAVSVTLAKMYEQPKSSWTDKGVNKIHIQWDTIQS